MNYSNLKPGDTLHSWRTNSNFSALILDVQPTPKKNVFRIVMLDLDDAGVFAEDLEDREIAGYDVVTAERKL